MRVKEEHQEIYFYLQEAEEEVCQLMEKLNASGDLYDEAKTLRHFINKILEEIKEYGPYNDLNTYFADNYGYESVSEILNEVKDRLKKLKEENGE